nr:hypothetical protein [Chlamydia suis]
MGVQSVSFVVWILGALGLLGRFMVIGGEGGVKGMEIVVVSTG